MPALRTPDPSLVSPSSLSPTDSVKPRTSTSSCSRRGGRCARLWRQIGSRYLRLLCVIPCGLASALGQDFNGDGWSDLLWRNHANGENAIWLMKNDRVLRIQPLTTAADTQWRLAGSGFFNQDTQRDLLWQHDTTGELAVWYLRGLESTSNTVLHPLPGKHWKVVAADDFNRDNQTDLVWQHELTGEKALWWMQGVQLQSVVSFDTTTGSRWRICAAGQFLGDAIPELVARDQENGAVALWMFDGTRLGTKVEVDSIARPDLDWVIGGALDMNADRRTDLVWRHAALGLNLISTMMGSRRVAEDFFQPAFATSWRLASQEIAETRYRLGINYGVALSASITNKPAPRIELRSNLPPPPQGRPRFQLYRRLAGTPDWGQALATELATLHWTDTNVVLGQRYEYLWRESGKPTVRYPLTAAILGHPIDHPGRLVVLVDQALTQAFPEEMERAWTRLEDDWTAEGWIVVRRLAPRQDDRLIEAASEQNRQHLEDLRRFLRREHRAGARGVLLWGHVIVPQSGYQEGDGHADHRGAWPSDMIYGDVDDVWKDGGTTYRQGLRREYHNVPGDGKFEHDFAPSDLELFVSRVDFSRLPEFGTGNAPSRAEAALMQRYAEKAHRYRVGEAPFPLPVSGITYSAFSLGGRTGVDTIVYEHAQRLLTAWSPEGTRALSVGEVFLNRSRPFLWNFLGGSGAPSTLHAGVNALQHDVASLVHLANEPPAAFHLLLGSYFGDWDSTNNFMRAVLATPNFGLAAAWLCPAPTPVAWRFQGMALGDCFGSGLPATVNGASGFFTGSNNRLLTLLGDPTLRLHTVPPPRHLRAVRTAEAVELTWAPVSQSGGYWVYRGAARTGPFTRATPMAITEERFVDRHPSPDQPFYMVRAAQIVESGSGSYTNLSLGARVQAP